MKISTWASSTDGEPVVSWSTYLENIWASIDDKRGSEIYKDRNRWEIDEADFVIRYTTHSISPQMRVRYGGNDYDIKAVINTNEANREIKLMTVKHK